MEIKYNEATLNRPTGDRVLDAPFVFIDLPYYIRQLKDEEAWKKSDHNSITVSKTEHTTTVLMCLHENAVIQKNSVYGFVSIQVLEGKIKMQVEKEETEVLNLQIVNLHPYVTHSIHALQDSILLLTNNVDPGGYKRGTGL